MGCAISSWWGLQPPSSSCFVFPAIVGQSGCFESHFAIRCEPIPALLKICKFLTWRWKSYSSSTAALREAPNLSSSADVVWSNIRQIIQPEVLLKSLRLVYVMLIVLIDLKHVEIGWASTQWCVKIEDDLGQNVHQCNLSALSYIHYSVLNTANSNAFHRRQ